MDAAKNPSVSSMFWALMCFHHLFHSLCLNSVLSFKNRLDKSVLHPFITRHQFNLKTHKNMNQRRAWRDNKRHLCFQRDRFRLPVVPVMVFLSVFHLYKSMRSGQTQLG